MGTLIVTILAGLILAAFLAPFEALRWWATQGAEEAEQTAAALRRLAESFDDESAQKRPEDHPACYVVYLTGVGASTETASPIGERPLLDEIQAALPQVRLISDVYPYSVDNRNLLSGRWSSWWWSLLERIGQTRFTGIVRAFVYIRNALQFAVAADDRYGPMYSLGVAQVIWHRLLDVGYDPRARRPVVLLGWSGGAQIALAAAWYLAGVGMPLYLVSLGGVLTSDPGLERLDHLWHIKGSKDWIQRFGKVFPGRWPRRRNTYWAKAVAQGRLTELDIGPMGHLGRGSYLSRSRLADGRTCRQTVVNTIVGILRGSGLGTRP